MGDSHQSNSRLLKELKEIESDKRSGVSVVLVDGMLNHMTGTIHGTCPPPRSARPGVRGRRC